MRFILKLGDLFRTKVNNTPDEMNMVKILDLRERLYEREKLDRRDTISDLLADNEACIKVVELKMKEVLFSIHSVKNERKLFDAYGDE